MVFLYLYQRKTNLDSGFSLIIYSKKCVTKISNPTKKNSYRINKYIFIAKTIFKSLCDKNKLISTKLLKC